MKILYSICIIWVLCFSANSVFAVKYEALEIRSSYPNVSKQHISEAKLMLTYVTRYKEKINNLYKKYSQETTLVMQDANSLLNDMSRMLYSIQNEKVNPEKVEEAMKTIVVDIKDLNNRMEIYLRQQQAVYQETINKQKQSYIRIWDKVSKILDALIANYTNTFSQKRSLSRSEKEIIGSLVKIRNENNKIKNFKNISFSSEREMQLYFKNIISNIRSEILYIKEKSR